MSHHLTVNVLLKNIIIQLQLQESYCLPVLTYATPALNLSSRQLKEMNVCWNGVYRKIFKSYKWESVKCFICGFDTYFSKEETTIFLSYGA